MVFSCSTRKTKRWNLHFQTKNQLHNNRSVIKLQVHLFTYHISTCTLQITIRKLVVGNLHRRTIIQKVDPNQLNHWHSNSHAQNANKQATGATGYNY